METTIADIDTAKPATPIDLNLREEDLVTEINDRLGNEQMELIATRDALLNDTINYGLWIVRRHRKPSDHDPNPFPVLVKRHTSPQAVAEILNSGQELK